MIWYLELNLMLRYLPNRDELLLRIVLALPKASRTGLVSRMSCRGHRRCGFRQGG